MPWHKIGNRIYSDAEMRAESTNLFHFLVDFGLPCFIGYMGATTLFGVLDDFQFFLVHTTTAKLICIAAGLLVFGVIYALRKLIIMTAFLAFVGLVVLGISADFFSWLSK